MSPGGGTIDVMSMSEPLLPIQPAQPEEPRETPEPPGGPQPPTTPDSPDGVETEAAPADVADAPDLLADRTAQQADPPFRTPTPGNGLSEEQLAEEVD